MYNIDNKGNSIVSNPNKALIYEKGIRNFWRSTGEKLQLNCKSWTHIANALIYEKRRVNLNTTIPSCKLQCQQGIFSLGLFLKNCMKSH